MTGVAQGDPENKGPTTIHRSCKCKKDRAPKPQNDSVKLQLLMETPSRKAKQNEDPADTTQRVEPLGSLESVDKI
jgi:hypothetical protein